jgi:hypothetical protein
MFLETKYCDRCEVTTQHYNGECGVCLDKKDKERIRMWEAQDVDTKLTNLRLRVENLERPEARY